MLQSRDEVLLAAAMCFLLSKHFRIMRKSTQAGDPLVGEQMIHKWGPVWLAKGRSKYFNMSMNTLDTIFLQMSPLLFHQSRISQYVLLHGGNSASRSLSRLVYHCLDGFLEDVNRRHKSLPISRSQEAWVDKTVWTGHAMRARNFADIFYGDQMRSLDKKVELEERRVGPVPLRSQRWIRR